MKGPLAGTACRKWGREFGFVYTILVQRMNGVGLESSLTVSSYTLFLFYVAILELFRRAWLLPLFLS